MKVGNNVQLVDLWRWRKLFLDLSKKIISHARRFRATDVLIEKASAGESMLQELRAQSTEGFPKPLSIKSSGDKAVRLEAVSGFMERGDVYLPAETDWLAPFLNELLGFPNAKHHDCVDASSQLLNWV